MFATIFFLKLINTILVLLFGILAVLIENPFDLGKFSWIAPALVALLVTVFYSIYTNAFKKIMRSCLNGVRHKIPIFIINATEKVTDSFSEYRSLSREQTIKILLAPLLSQLLGVLLYLTTARALHLQLPLVTLIQIIALVYLIQLMPASISGLGLREGALVFLLPYYGISAASALAFSLLLFGFNPIIVLIGGLTETKIALLDPMIRLFATKEPRQ